jgi:hypothetical protein
VYEIWVLDTTVRRLAVLAYVWPEGSVVLSVSLVAKFDPYTMSVCALPSAVQDEHFALDTFGVSAAGALTLKVVGPEFDPALFET